MLDVGSVTLRYRDEGIENYTPQNFLHDDQSASAILGGFEISRLFYEIGLVSLGGNRAREFLVRLAEGFYESVSMCGDFSNQACNGEGTWGCWSLQCE